MLVPLISRGKNTGTDGFADEMQDWTSEAFSTDCSATSVNFASSPPALSSFNLPENIKYTAIGMKRSEMHTASLSILRSVLENHAAKKPKPEKKTMPEWL
jgi:hypothetical protein